MWGGVTGARSLQCRKQLLVADGFSPGSSIVHGVKASHPSDLWANALDSSGIHWQVFFYAPRDDKWEDRYRDR
jgi:hypothetical protein